MRYLIYTRVSPKGSDHTGGETSIPAQLAAVRAYLTARDPAADLLTASDELRSGKDISGRPAFRQIVADLHAGRASWDVFAVWRLDRAFRSTADAAPFFRELLRQGKGFASATENLDLSSPAGRAMLGMLCIFAEFERESGSQRTKLKMVSIAQRGEWPVGHPPLGYRRTAPHCNTLAVDPARAPTVQALFADYATGAAGAIDLARKHGIRGKTTVLHILRNRTYLGKICYAGAEYPARHPPLVSEQLFAAVQARLPRTVTGPRLTRRQYPYLLSGLVRCQCGRPMTPGGARGRGRTYHYYRCTDPDCGLMTRADRLDLAVLNALSRVQFDPRTIRAALNQFVATAAARRSRLQPDLDAARQTLRTAEHTAARLKRAMLDGLITRATAPAWNADYAAALAAIETGKTAVSRLTAAVDNTIPGRDALESAALQTLTELGRRLRLAADAPESLRPLVAAAVTRVHKSENGWTCTLFGDTSTRFAELTKMAPAVGPARIPFEIVLAVAV
jgi:DNA invertase Pin-like site-specific DNA recombinase